MCYIGSVLSEIQELMESLRFGVVQDLDQLAAELRAEIVHSVSQTGGHLSSSLGVVELTVAIHHVFNAPEDKVIWDVGHQVGRVARILSHEDEKK